MIFSSGEILADVKYEVNAVINENSFYADRIRQNLIRYIFFLFFLVVNAYRCLRWDRKWAYTCPVPRNRISDAKFIWDQRPVRCDFGRVGRCCVISSMARAETPGESHLACKWDCIDDVCAARPVQTRTHYPASGLVIVGTRPRGRWPRLQLRAIVIVYFVSADPLLLRGFDNASHPMHAPCCANRRNLNT